MNGTWHGDLGDSQTSWPRGTNRTRAFASNHPPTLPTRVYGPEQETTVLLVVRQNTTRRAGHGPTRSMI